MGIETLQVELRSTLGDGLTLVIFFLVISDEEYITETASVVKPILPEKSTPPSTPPIPTVATRSATSTNTNTANSYDIYRMEYLAFQQNLDTYLLYHNMSKYLVKQIVVVVSCLYIEELEDAILKFGNISPSQILSTCELHTERLRQKISTEMQSIREVLYRELRKVKKCAKVAREVIPNSVFIRSRHRNIGDTELFSHTYYE